MEQLAINKTLKRRNDNNTDYESRNSLHIPSITKSVLVCSIHSYPSPSLSPGLSPVLVDSLLSHAFKAWSDAAPLSFRRLPNDSTASAAGGDIRVSFSRLLHEDGYPFDGEGGTLAHAFFPGRDAVAGDTHFDNDEKWSYGGIY